MTFKPSFLKKIGIQPESVPKGLTAEFTTTEHSQLRISFGLTQIIVPTKKYYSESSDDVTSNLASKLIKTFGARPISTP